MTTNPWIALDATTSPDLLGTELRHAWDDFLSTGRPERARTPIAESWHRSQAAGIDPARSRAPTLVMDRRDMGDRWMAHPLGAATALIRRWLGSVADRSEQLIVVTDADGLLLWMDGDVKLQSAAADTMNFVEGAMWRETDAGTNAIGTALAADHPVQVHAAEHFSEVVHGWTCSAVPVHDPDDGTLLGVIDLTGRAETAHPASLAAVVAAARAVEADLRVRAQERDAALRVRYLERLTSDRSRLALVSGSGRVIADHPSGFLRAERIDIRAGGALVLPNGRPAVAEAIEREDAYLVRPLDEGSESIAGVDQIAELGTHAITASLDPMTGYQRAERELSHLAQEQAALRRVATLVASQATAEEILVSVAEEVARLLRAHRGTVCRFEPDGMLTVMASWPARKDRSHRVGIGVDLEGESVAALVQRSGRPSRVDRDGAHPGPNADRTRWLGEASRSTIGAPILAEGRLWGVILAHAIRPRPFEKQAESWLLDFAELVATAISNAVARAELNASRARIIDAADQARRRIDRDLHDGAQQRLVSIALELRAAASDPTAGPQQLRHALDTAAYAITAALDELRQISHGIHPAILSQGGLGPALRALCRRSAIPVELEISTSERFAERVEVTAYYVVSEALTNTVKHSRATLVHVRLRAANGSLHLSVRDNGVGGADPADGSGLIGLRDRVEAVGGSLTVDGPVGDGTDVLASLPLTSTDDPARTTCQPGIDRSNS